MFILQHVLQLKVHFPNNFSLLKARQSCRSIASAMVHVNTCIRLYKIHSIKFVSCVALNSAPRHFYSQWPQTDFHLSTVDFKPDFGFILIQGTWGPFPPSKVYILITF